MSDFGFCYSGSPSQSYIDRIMAWLFTGAGAPDFSTYVAVKDVNDTPPGYTVPSTPSYMVTIGNAPQNGCQPITFTAIGTTISNNEVVIENAVSCTVNRIALYTGEMWVPCSQIGQDSTWMYYPAGSKVAYWKRVSSYTDEFGTPLVIPYYTIDIDPVSVDDGDTITIPAGTIEIDCQVVDGLDIADYGVERIAAHLAGLTSLPTESRFIGLYDENGDELTVPGYARIEYPTDEEISSPPYKLVNTFTLGANCEVHGWRIYNASTGGSVVIGSEFSEHTRIEAGDEFAPNWPRLAAKVGPFTVEVV